MPLKPLAGVRVAVTRPIAQAEDLAEPLRKAGADVLIAPLIRIAAAPIEGVLLQAAQAAPSYDWIVFSSANGVELFVAALRAAGKDPRELKDVRVACVGPATAEAAERHGLSVEVVPEKYVGDAIVGALSERTKLADARILLARAAGARAELANGLRERGARVDDVELYRSVPDASGAAALRHAIAANRIDVVSFTAASAVRSFAQHAEGPGAARIAVIGPITAQAVRDCGMQVAIEADPHTVEGLLAALARYYAARRGEER